MKLTQTQKLKKELDKLLKVLSKEIDKSAKSFLNDLELKSIESGVGELVFEPYRQMLLNIYKCWALEVIKDTFLYERATCFHFKKLDDLHKSYIDKATEYEHKAVLALQSTKESDQKKQFIKCWNVEHKAIPEALNKHQISNKIIKIMKEFWEITA